MIIKTLKDYTDRQIETMGKRCPKFEYAYTSGVPMYLIDTANFKKLVSEYELYKKQQGYTYLQLLDRTGNIYPSEQEFLKFYFTDWEDEYLCLVGTFKCTSHKLAEQFGKILEDAYSYHDTYNQCYVDVEVDGTMINIVGGDY